MIDQTDYIPGNKAWITQRFHPVFDGTQSLPVAPVVLVSEAGPVLISESGEILIASPGGSEPIGVLIRFA